MTKLRDLYYCDLCHNVTEVANDGASALVCCGKDMSLLEAKSEDSSVEKHVPFLIETEKGVLIKVGENQAHPMLDKHHVKFIEVTTDDMVLRKELKAGDEPQAEFPVKKSEIKEIREWCNLHGLWSYK
ncbi:MAG: desulfoferrodoxin [Candidatus Cloacimonadota bacterium]|nr:MAG: desulfoferrodoxin [Candidatus Cloacimonadota bacterium]